MTLNRFSHPTRASAVCALFAITTLVTGGATTAQSSPRPSIVSNLNHCKISQLSVRRVNSDAAMGHIGVSYAFTNISSSPCTLYGYPGFVPLDAKGQPLQGVKTTWSERNYLHHAQRHQLTLAPGAQASFEVVYNHISSDGQSCSESAKVEITPPNTHDHFSLAEHLSPCREISVTPVEAGIIQN